MIRVSAGALSTNPSCSLGPGVQSLAEAGRLRMETGGNVLIWLDQQEVTAPE